MPPLLAQALKYLDHDVHRAKHMLEFPVCDRISYSELASCVAGHVESLASALYRVWADHC